MPTQLRNKRNHLRQLIFGKNEWSRPLTDEERNSGFPGWHERGYLPHCDFPDLLQFVTFRLSDSMPASRRGEWEHLLKIEEARERRIKLEEYLDQGLGNCVLRDAQVAKVVQAALLYFHNDRYELYAWCVMPNHVHVLLDVKRTPLWKTVKSWKQFSQLEANRLFGERRPPARRVSGLAGIEPGRRPALQWQREYWDTFMRNEEQQQRAVRYIENNPVKARLCRAAENWPFTSARFRDDYKQLVL